MFLNAVNVDEIYVKLIFESLKFYTCSANLTVQIFVSQ
jgi:hypothetical protein